MNPEMNPQQSASILSRMFGYQGPANKGAIDQFLAANPAAAARMGKYQEAMQQMVSGRNIAGMQTGGAVQPTSYTPTQAATQGAAPAPTAITGVEQPDAKRFENLQQKLADAQEEFRKAELAFSKADPKKKNEYAKLRSARNAAQRRLETVSRDIGTQVQQSQQQQVFQAGQPVQRQTVAEIKPTQAQFVDASAGQVGGPQQAGITSTVGTAQTAAQPGLAPTSQATTVVTEPQAAAILAGTQAATGQVTPDAQVSAATQAASSVSNLQAEQGTAIMMNNPVQRQIEAGELVTGAADAAKAAAFTEQIQAAEATPTKKATVAGQLETLMQDFDGGQTPAWAAGAMRNATQMLVSRGLGASSIAGQAVIQAAMESALPIAQADAATQAQFESQNLSNRQQRAMLAAQQRAEFLGMEFDQDFQARVANASRIADVANMNFTAEQQVALENSRLANTMQLENLNNRQAMVIAEASALANLDLSNLNNRQQAAVQNAQSFLQMDMTNLTNEQQTAMFKAQSNLQALFTDQAAINAAEQFNASSENQTNQFFANLQAQVSQFNAAQQNAISQFDADEANAMEQFNAEIAQQRQLFNAQNSLIVAQANAKWRQDLDTANTAAQNAANADLAATLNALSAASIDQIWQRERDIMAYAFQASESALDREVSILLGDKNLQAFREKLAADEGMAKDALKTRLALELFGGGGGLFG